MCILSLKLPTSLAQHGYECDPNRSLILSLATMRYPFKTILASAVLAGILGLLFLGIGVAMYAERPRARV